MEKEVAWIYFHGPSKCCFKLLQEGLQLVLTSMFYNHALLGCDVGWEWTRYWVWADGWVGGGCREYSMSYLNFDASTNGHLYNSFKIWAAYDSLFFSHLYKHWCIPILVMILWCFSIWISHSLCINGAHFVLLKICVSATMWTPNNTFSDISWVTLTWLCYSSLALWDV